MNTTPPGTGGLPGADRIVLLDGGLATRLTDRGNDVGGVLWSAEILRDRPDEVRAAHADFFAAGAQVATTGSYQVTADGVEEVGGSAAEADVLLRRSVTLAREAADEASARDGRPRWVAASIGPYGAGPGRGTEYDGDYGLSTAELAVWHRHRIEVLAGAGPDVLLAETVPSILEIEALVEELARVDLPSWLSIVVVPGRLGDGTPLAEAAALLKEATQGATGPCAVGVNCSRPTDVLEAVRDLGDGLGEDAAVPLIAYPNSGEVWDREARVWTQTPDAATVVDLLPELLVSGVRIIGGCCRVGVEEIAEVAGALLSRSGTSSGRAHQTDE
jgi:homocysteine S-methyltransferase